MDEGAAVAPPHKRDASHEFVWSESVCGFWAGEERRYWYGFVISAWLKSLDMVNLVYVRAGHEPVGSHFCKTGYAFGTLPNSCIRLLFSSACMTSACDFFACLYHEFASVPVRKPSDKFTKLDSALCRSWYTNWPTCL